MAWNAKKALAVRESFDDFVSHLRIDSKEEGGRTPLRPYGAQRRFLDGVFEGLQHDVHSFTVLKARQLGITTISLALDLFWLGLIDGLQGALIFDTDSNKEKARVLLKRYIESLPASLHFPTIAAERRYGLVLENGSSFDYLVAGIRKSAGSAGLGRSRGLNFVHATECSSWADLDGLASLERSLAEKYPDRLYIWESTARGFNVFHDMWENALADDLSRRAIFIGWWAKEDYSISRDSPLFARYGVQPPSAAELVRIDAVSERYDFHVTQEQLAWFRHQADPRGEGEDDLDDRVASDIIDQELPWTEEDAFLATGSQFFSGEILTNAMKEAKKHSYKGFRYHMTEDFLSTIVEQVRTPRETQLRVFEEPDPTGTYVVGADPAFGSSEDADRYVIQVLRCYADGVDQVAEFCATVLTTYQFAWIIAHLCGAYANARLILEINGPGEAVANEFRTLKTLLTTGYMKGDAERQGLKNMFEHVKSYLYHRIDSLSGAGQFLHWKTTLMLKKGVMNRLRDAFQQKALNVRSLECLEEMRHMIEHGDSIKAEGNKKDDRVMALALAVRAWNDAERMRMIAQERTRENELKRANFTEEDMSKMFMGRTVQDFFNRQVDARQKAQRAARRTRWNW